MPIIKVSPFHTIYKDTQDWTNRDFLFYFSNKLKKMTGKELNIPPVAWPGFLGRMKGFRAKLSISNQAYKDFIDNVFSELFEAKDYVPAFGSIVSERVFNILRNYSLKEYSNDEFTKLREQLYRDVMLFKKQ